MEKRGHSLDILFPVVLLAVYVLAAVTVILQAGAAYRKVEDRSRSMADGPAALAYVTERLHQGDEAGVVRVGTLGDIPALVFAQGEDGRYVTYIYCYDGSLRELMIRRELAPEPETGRALLPMAEFLPEDAGGGLLKLSCTDLSGQTRVCWVSLLSEEVG